MRLCTKDEREDEGNPSDQDNVLCSPTRLRLARTHGTHGTHDTHGTKTKTNETDPMVMGGRTSWTNSAKGSDIRVLAVLE